MSAPEGHILNRSATRGDLALRAPAGVIARAPEDFAGLDDALAEMAAAGVRRVAISGGDGTVREVLSRAPEIWRAAPPDFAIIPCGNTNLIARKAGGVGAEAVGGLGALAGRRRIPMLRADRTGARTLRGFILGAGAYETATRVAQREIASRHGPQVAIAVLRLIFSRELRAPTMIGFGPDGAPPALSARTLTAMTSLPGALIFGMSPFWGDGAGPIRWLDVGADPPLLPVAAVFAAVGRPRRWMREQFRSGVCDAVELRLDTGFVMDGERFDAGAGGRIVITAKESATFLSA